MRPRKVSYEGRDYPVSVLSGLLGVGRAVLLRWVAQGGVSAAKVQLHQREREERRKAREAAREHGLKAQAIYQRVMRGETLLEACTRKALSRAEVCARMREAKRKEALQLYVVSEQESA